MEKIIEFLKYPSTWAGLTVALTIVGVHFSPEQAAAVQQAGIALVGAIWLFFSDSDVKGA